MDLDEFIKNSLIQITDGLKKANQEIHNNQKTEGIDYFHLSLSGSDKAGSLVEYDIAVTTRLEKSGGGRNKGSSCSCRIKGWRKGTKN